MKIMIGADLVPTASNIELFKQGDAKTIVGERFLKVMQDCDYRMFNLELALTDKETLLSLRLVLTSVLPPNVSTVIKRLV